MSYTTIDGLGQIAGEAMGKQRVGFDAFRAHLQLACTSSVRPHAQASCPRFLPRHLRGDRRSPSGSVSIRRRQRRCLPMAKEAFAADGRPGRLARASRRIRVEQAFEVEGLRRFSLETDTQTITSRPAVGSKIVYRLSPGASGTETRRAIVAIELAGIQKTSCSSSSRMRSDAQLVPLQGRQA